MKLQFKLDKKLFQDLATEHIEKVVFGVVVLCFLWFAFQSLMLKGYAERPEKLQQATDIAKIHIDNGTKIDLPFDDFKSIVQRSRDWVDDRRFATTTPWDITPRPKPKTRGTPAVIPVKNLRGTAGRGPLMVTARRGEEEAQGKRWIALVGLVPLAEQSKAYKEVFESATHKLATRDTPSYKGFFVERSEVDPKQPNKLKATKLFMSEAVLAASSTMSVVKPDVVDAKYIRPELCVPLPKKEEGDWGAEGALRPQIPLAGEASPDDKKNAKKPVEPVEPDAVDDEKEPPEGDDPDAPPVENAGGGRGMPNFLGGVPPRGAANAKAAAAVESNDPKYLLFRFIDYDVEPGKQYSYRVFLRLKNPNYKVDTKHLTNPEDTKTPYIGKGTETLGRDGKTVVKVKIDEKKADWSALSPPIAVPEDIQVLASDVTAKPGTELTGKVRVSTWIEETGVNASKDFTVLAGTGADFAGKDPQSTDPDGISYKTDQVVLDIVGGERIGQKDRDLKRAGQILVMDKNGKLVIHDELHDKAIIESENKVDKEEAEATEEDTETPRPARRAAGTSPDEFEGLPDDFDSPKKGPAKKR